MSLLPSPAWIQFHIEPDAPIAWNWLKSAQPSSFAALVCRATMMPTWGRECDCASSFDAMSGGATSMYDASGHAAMTCFITLCSPAS